MTWLDFITDSMDMSLFIWYLRLSILRAGSVQSENMAGDSGNFLHQKKQYIDKKMPLL